jgi:hypothetical protein
MQVFHYQGGTSPPADWAQWSTFVTTVVKAMVDRYGATEVRFSLYDFMCRYRYVVFIKQVRALHCVKF